MLPRAGHQSGAAPLQSLRYVVVDTELTSLDPATNRLLSVGAIAMDGAKIKLGEQFYRIVNPKAHIPRESILVHELRPADVARGESPERAVRDLAQFAGGAVIVGHFVRIDLRALRKELWRPAKQLPKDAIDTARAHHWLTLNEAKRRGLDEVNEPLDLAAVAPLYGLGVEKRHHALHDAFVTAQLWQRLLPRLLAQGVATLNDALRVARG